MSSESKFLIGFGLITLLIIAAGVFFFGKQSNNQNGQSNEAQESIDQNRLISGAKHTVGNPEAPVTVVEFADLQCPACGAAHPIVAKLLETYPEDVYYVFRHYPLAIHKNAKKAARAAEAAGAQGKFFEMVDKLFTHQDDWENSTSADEIFERYAKELKLDLEKYKTDVENVDDPINSDYALGNQSAVKSTPTFFINGQIHPGIVQLSQFEQIIQSSKTATEESTDSANPTNVNDATHDNDANTSEEPAPSPVENQ